MRLSGSTLRDQGLGFKVQGLSFGAVILQGFWFRVQFQGLGLLGRGLGCEILVLSFKVQGLWLSGLGLPWTSS